MHPYKQAPAQAFWSKSVSAEFDARALLPPGVPLIRAGDKVASAGSCFAANLVPYLEREGLSYLRTAPRPPLLAEAPPENFSYDKFSAAYGNVYTVTQMLQLLRRSLGRFRPQEDRWLTPQGVIDPFRPGLRYCALTQPEFEVLTAQYLHSVRAVFEQADVFIFTLGLTEAWVSKADGAVFPACPGTIAGTFDATRHSFANLGIMDTQWDLDAFLTELREVNPKVRVILTVSPVPLVATGEPEHVLLASTHSKSVLRAVAGEAARKHAFVTYFPAYEIVTGPQAPESYFEADRRNVSEQGVQAVMRAFLAHCELPAGATAAPPASPAQAMAALSQKLADAECEEAMADR